jgi:hypothetical protein
VVFDQVGEPVVVDEPSDDPSSEIGVFSLEDFLRKVREGWLFGKADDSRKLPKRESLEAIDRSPISLLKERADALARAR